MSPGRSYNVLSTGIAWCSCAQFVFRRAVWRSVQIHTRADEPGRKEQPREHDQRLKRRDAETQRADDDGGEPERRDPAWQRARDPGAQRHHPQTEREDDRRDGVERERRAEQIVDNEQPSAYHCQQRSQRSPATSPPALEGEEAHDGEQEQEVNNEIGQVDGRSLRGGKQRGDATQRSCGDGGDTCPAHKRVPVHGGASLSSQAILPESIGRSALPCQSQVILCATLATRASSSYIDLLPTW